MRFGAYHRVSDANGRDQAAETTVTDKQAWEQIDAWATLRGHSIAERYLDWDVTGSKMERPELDRMLADLEAGRIDGIVVAQVDRLSRADVGDALAVVKQIAGPDEANPRPLVLLDLGIDPSTEFGEFGLTILLGLARMQWRRYKRQWTSAQSRAIERGVWIGPAPVGYAKTTVGHDAKGKPIVGPLAPDDHGPVITEAFKLAASDPERGLHLAAAHLQRELPEQRWIKTDVRRLLSNRAYLGEHHATGKITHDALTTLPLWTAAQTEPAERRSNGDYVLSKLATCEHCGAGMTGQLQGVHGRKYRRYRCSNAGCAQRCSIRAEVLETYVRDELRQRLPQGEWHISQGGDELAQAEAKLEKARGALLRFSTNLDWLDSIGPEAAAANAAALRQRVERASEHYATLAGGVARTQRLPGADQLDDDELLVRAIVGTELAIRVRRGRGTVDERVTLAFGLDELDNGARVAAA